MGRMRSSRFLSGAIFAKSVGARERSLCAAGLLTTAEAAQTQVRPSGARADGASLLSVRDPGSSPGQALSDGGYPRRIKSGAGLLGITQPKDLGVDHSTQTFTS